MPNALATRTKPGALVSGASARSATRLYSNRDRWPRALGCAAVDSPIAPPACAAGAAVDSGAAGLRLRRLPRDGAMARRAVPASNAHSANGKRPDWDARNRNRDCRRAARPWAVGAAVAPDAFSRAIARLSRNITRRDGLLAQVR